MLKLILGSTSPYRKELLEKLQIPFECQKPMIDEDQEKDPSLSPLALAQHLAKLKAQSLRQSNSVIVGGDQLVAFSGRIYGKAHHFSAAEKQLQDLQGKTHELITAVHLCTPETDFPFVNITQIKLKPLSTKQIQNYLNLDQPFDCAGSYKIEKNGFSLIESITTTDFTAIQGLPLLELSSNLNRLGFVSLQGDLTHD